MIYDYTVTTGKGEALNLADYKGKVIMVVNTATGCGFTPQYAPIEQMYKDYHDKGLEMSPLQTIQRKVHHGIMSGDGSFDTSMSLWNC